MANSRDVDGERRARRRERSHSTLERQKPYESSGKDMVTPEPQDVDLPEVRRSRLERPGGSTTSLETTELPNMTSESHATLPSSRSGSTHRRRRRKEHHAGPREVEHRRRRKSTARDDSRYVYPTHTSRVQSSRAATSDTRRSDTRRHGRDTDDTESEESSIVSDEEPSKPRTRKVRVVYITEEGSKISGPRERRVRPHREHREHREHIRESGESIRSSRTSHSRRKSTADLPHTSPPKRSTSTRDLPSQSRPPLKRSSTTTSHSTSVKTPHASSTTGTSSSKRSSFLGSFFGPSIQPPQVPEKLVECLTCSDDIPRSKCAKLKCGHRMCHSCLRRIFKLSVTDPQHMPPKCCTADVIPLKHVERLFDTSFKRNWNIKYQEYTTKNRIYCPARRCGEWIKPGNIHKEDGRKYGKCGRCKTKVCCLCNGKWHGTNDCPKDEETNRLLETAKQAGWQRCYSCRTMVELKEGCNHMTCHCTAEFCMLCGLKWKSCNCPWFSYDAVEADRLNHMRVPEAPGGQEQRPHHLRRPPPNNQNDDMNQRRRQERADEELARRLQAVALDNDDYQGGIGNIHGIGNGAGHFMNQDYVRAAHNILTGTIDQANIAANYVLGVRQARGARQPPPPPPPLGVHGPGRHVPPPPILRRHTVREQAYNTAQGTRPSERVVPRRTRTDYANEAAVHAPLGRAPQRASSIREVPRPAVLAGLGGPGRGSNRVGAWRTHVEPGAPLDGILSM